MNDVGFHAWKGRLKESSQLQTVGCHGDDVAVRNVLLFSGGEVSAPGGLLFKVEGDVA